ncbi:MAG: putative lipase / esterase protein [Herminiimonas sp.]|nr:putative lipase / esterase protein [Herminiimonas sp.]
MTSNPFRTVLLVAASALMLTACSGGDDSSPRFNSVVSFGDSLSDVGTYAAATGPNGGKFTTNPGPVWIENIASRLGLSITPNIVGFGADQTKWVVCGKPACTGYAQGGARVTAPNGIGNETGTQAGALTIPVKTQIANHLAAHNGRFNPAELVFLFAGNNDVFFQLGVFNQVAADPAKSPAVAKQVTDAAMTAAANELVLYARDEILAKGAQFVVMVNLPNSAQTPFGQKSLDANGRAVLEGLVNAFNTALAKGIDDQQLNVLFVDANTAGRQVYTNPAANGIINNQDAACDPVKIAAATGGREQSGSSLFCSGATLTAAAMLDNRFQFADSAHPSTLGHKLLSDVIINALSERNWL